MLLGWSTDPDFWMRRAAILAQLKAKAATDPGLLARIIETNMADPEFFIRKAIGWALREYSKTAPEWVAAFVAEHAATLSPLSRKEALRRLPRPHAAHGPLTQVSSAKCRFEPPKRHLALLR